MNHDHHHIRAASSMSSHRLLWAIILNFVITLTELIGGVLAGSLSLISDALHNFSDAVALIISGVAVRIGNQPKTLRYTFGKKRAEILAATVNAAVLVLICFFLIKEAYLRFQHPELPSGMLMIAVGTIGFVANLIGTLLLHPHTHQNLNFRAAYLHLLSDAVSSAGVVLGGIAILWWSIYWIDPLITVLIALYVLWESFNILKRATDIMMMAAPESISLEDIGACIEAIPGVENVHHTHLWQMSEGALHFEAHIQVGDMSVRESEKILAAIEHELHHRFNITHTTVQCECGRCDSSSLI